MCSPDLWTFLDDGGTCNQFAWVYTGETIGARNTPHQLRTLGDSSKLCVGDPKVIVSFNEYWTYDLCVERHLSLGWLQLELIYDLKNLP